MIELKRKDTPLVSNVVIDEFIKASEKSFDCIFTGESKFFPWEKPDLGEFNLCVIVGGSGSGKTNLLKEFGEINEPEWDNTKAIVSHFNTPDEAINLLGAVGLNSIPTWYKPFNVLSNGEQFRANLARKLKDNAIIDEFTSVVDRNVAKSTSLAISKYIKKNNIKNVVLATCHRDIIDWLEPDWVIDTDTGHLLDGFFFKRPPIEIKIHRTTHNSWGIFKNHHYLSGELNKASRCFIALWGDEIVGFAATLTMPSGTLKNAWRGSRLVVLPEYQGMNIGTNFSNALGEIHLEEGKRFFSRTSHPRLGLYRELSPLWRGTSKNKVLRKDITHKNIFNNHYADNKRICFSHEYIGEQTNQK